MPDKSHHPWHGLPVTDSILCHFCQRRPRTGERFGTGEKDWDAPGLICPDCFQAVPVCAKCHMKFDGQGFCACEYEGDVDFEGEIDGEEKEL